MKTLIIYNDVESTIKFILVDGDYSRFHNIVLNGLEDNDVEFLDWMFDEVGKPKHTFSEDKSLLEDKEWGKVAIVTWLP